MAKSDLSLESLASKVNMYSIYCANGNCEKADWQLQGQYAKCSGGEGSINNEREASKIEHMSPSIC